MAPLESRRRSRARFEEENGGHSSDSDTAKRRKRTINGLIPEEVDDRVDLEAEDDIEVDQSYDNTLRDNEVKPSPPSSQSQPGQAINPFQFQPGAIVRVLLENFVTYEHAVFNPGPNLNMVIGPNGTGKSSLVCAICLGLGFHPKHLGRASSMGEFVKHGKESAIVEIEIQGRPDQRTNPVIRLQIRKEDNKSKWWLNGKEANHQTIKNVTTDLRIQIDNLCQFLPQDRVAEFAGLTPIQLLHETLRAAAPEPMIEAHEQLKELHRKQKEVKARLDDNAETLKNHESRQQGSQADVDRLREREAIQKKIEDLQLARALAEYNNARRLMSEAKQKKHDAARKLKELERACGPALEAVNKKHEYSQRILAVVDERKRALREAEAACEELYQAIEAQDERIKHLQNKKTAEEGSHTAKKTEIAKIRRTITDLEAKLQNKPPEFVAADWNQKIVGDNCCTRTGSDANMGMNSAQKNMSSERTRRRGVS